MVSNARSSLYIRREDVSLSDRDILRRYLGIDTISCKISSPLREDDDTPSFTIREYDGRVVWKDFGTGESGSVVSLLAKLWSVDYKEALVKIKLDSGYTTPKKGLVRKYSGEVKLQRNTSIKVKVRPWKEWDVQFWKSFGISRSFAKWCNVHPISHAFFYNDNGESACIPMDKYAYAYFEWKDGKQSVKLYQPYSETMKWLSKHDASVWDLWKHAFAWADTKSDEACIITSSRKDAMCLWENLNIPSMALQGEGYLPKPQVMNQVLDRFRKVYVWYDNDFSHVNDNPGQDNARKLIALYPKLINVCIPDDYLCKDPSDLVKVHGTKELKKVFNIFT